MLHSMSVTLRGIGLHLARKQIYSKPLEWSYRMFQRILVPLDGSERAEQALPLAARLIRAWEGSLLLVRVVMPSREVGLHTREAVPFLRVTTNEELETARR